MTIYAYHSSPIGTLQLVGEPEPPAVRLSGIYMEDHRRGPTPGRGWHDVSEAFGEVGRQLDEYFAGRRRQFDLPLAPSGSPFQLAVWEELRRIPWGTRVTYGELAARLGKPRSARAVGAAVGRNPISIVVPCHRVLGAGGRLTGYAGGLERKRILLDLESGAADSR